MKKANGYKFEGKVLNGFELSKILTDLGIANKVTNDYGTLLADVIYPNREGFEVGKMARIQGTNITFKDGIIYQDFNPRAQFEIEC